MLMEVDAGTVVMKEKVAVHEAFDSFNRKRGSGRSVVKVGLSLSSNSNNRSERSIAVDQATSTRPQYRE